MMTKKYVFLVLLFLSCNCRAFADLYPILLRMHLSAVKDTWSTQEPLAFRLAFTSSGTKPHTILLPGAQKSGTKLIYLSVFTMEGNFYREVARENRAISMSALQGPVSGNVFRYLEPGQTAIIPLFVNDTIQYSRHIEAQHLLQGLAPGRYAVLAWYDPWQDTLSSYVFNKRSPFEKKHTEDTNKLTLPEEGLSSNYATIVLVAGKPTVPASPTTVFCPTSCGLCRAIEREKWNTVQSIITRQTYSSGKYKRRNTDSSWRMPHRNISYLSDPPYMIQASLPSYLYRQFIFKNSKGYHYFSAGWQIGIIYRNRSRVQSFLHLLGLGTRITTSNTDYYRLVSFRSY